MTDSEFKKQKSRVERAFAKWRNPTGMDGWIVCHVWHRDGTAGGGAQYADATARTSVSWEYLHVTFHWNLQQIEQHNDEEIDRIVRHEICHALINEMRMWAPEQISSEKQEEAMKHEERTVTQLAMVLRWCRMDGQKDPVKKRKRPHQKE